MTNVPSCAIYLLLCAHGASTSTPIRSEITEGQGSVEYYPASNLSIIGEASGIRSVAYCGMKCFGNKQCLTATFYLTSQTCMLFMERNSWNSLQSNANAIVITMVNRCKSISSVVTIESIRLLPSKVLISNMFIVLRKERKNQINFLTPTLSDSNMVKV